MKRKLSSSSESQPLEAYSLASGEVLLNIEYVPGRSSQSQQLVISGSQPESQPLIEQGSRSFQSQSSFEIRYGYGHFYTRNGEWQYSQAEDAGKALSVSGDFKRLTKSSSLSQGYAKSQNLGASTEIADLKRQLAEKDREIEELKEQLKYGRNEQIDIRKTSELKNPSSYSERVKPNIINSNATKNASQGRQ